MLTINNHIYIYMKTINTINHNTYFNHGLLTHHLMVTAPKMMIVASPSPGPQHRPVRQCKWIAAYAAGNAWVICGTLWWFLKP